VPPPKIHKIGQATGFELTPLGIIVDTLVLTFHVCDKHYCDSTCSDWVLVSVDSHVEMAGILEMGGASTQIAFAPRGDILADKFPVLIGGRRYPLYVHSYLYYGQNAVDDRIKHILDAESSTNSSQPVQHPCMLRGKQAHQVNLTTDCLTASTPN